MLYLEILFTTMVQTGYQATTSIMVEEMLVSVSLVLHQFQRVSSKCGVEQPHNHSSIFVVRVLVSVSMLPDISQQELPILVSETMRSVHSQQDIATLHSEIQPFITTCRGTSIPQEEHRLSIRIPMVTGMWHSDPSHSIPISEVHTILLSEDKHFISTLQETITLPWVIMLFVE